MFIEIYFQAPIVTPIFVADLYRSGSETAHSKSSVLAVSLNFTHKKDFLHIKNFYVIVFQFRFNVRGLLSTNIDVDRHLFYWEGGSVSSAYPPTPACIARDHPGML